MLSLKVSEPQRRLSHLQIRFTKVALILGDVLAFALAGLLAALLARSWGDVQDAHWLVTQHLERYGAWLVLVTLGLVFFLVRHRHYSDRKPFWTELGEILKVLLMLAVFDLALIGIARWNSSRLWWLS